MSPRNLGNLDTTITGPYGRSVHIYEVPSEDEISRDTCLRVLQRGGCEVRNSTGGNERIYLMKGCLNSFVRFTHVIEQQWPLTDHVNGWLMVELVSNEIQWSHH